MEWKDETSYGRGERGKVEPRTWATYVGRVRIVVTKHLRHGDEWVSHCHPLYNKVPLGTTSLEIAKIVALEKFLQKVGPFVHASQMVKALLLDEEEE